MQRTAEVKEAELATFLANLPDDVFLKLITDAGLTEDGNAADKETREK